MFIGRQKELSILNKHYQTDTFQCIVMYGRRRIGKTSVIKEFIKDKDAVYFTGIEGNEKQNLENFSKAIWEQTENIYGTAPVYDSYQSALEFIFEKAQDKRLILCIDEYPYIAKASKSLASTLQFLIDKYKDTSKLYIILCGSSMSYMEENVLSYKAPLYGRRTAQLQINPLNFFESIAYIKNFSNEDKALAYGIVGGTPQYLLQINDKLSLEENIKNIFLEPSSFMYEEPVNFLKQEMREPAVYNSIISAIANGYTKLSEISSKTGEQTSICSMYIKNLISLGIVKKEIPAGEDKSKKTTYSITDNMFRFWYRFIQPNMSAISKGAVENVYKYIEQNISKYMGSVFENICIDYMWQMLLMGKSEVTFNNIGRWWGTSNITKTQIEIDVFGTDNENRAIFGECKWTNKKADVDVLDNLIDKSMNFKYEKYYYIFSKSGFTDALKSRAEKMENVRLVTYEDMVAALAG